MEKILIIGCPGSGKSTFARKLREITELPLYYLDMIWHTPERTNISREEFDNRLDAILQKEQWIIDGNYCRTMETRLKKCDTVFLLDFPLEICISGVESRIGQKREDMPWVEQEFDEEFRQWILDFPKQTLPKIHELLERYREDRTVIVFHSRQETETYLAELRASLPDTAK